MIKYNFVRYPRKSYFIIPTIVFTFVDEYNAWTIDIRWLRFMFTIAKFNKNET